MILTVTPNTAIDHVLEVENFHFGERLSVTGEAECVGGKGNLVSVFAASLGMTSVALGFAAGANGRRLASLLRARDVEPDFSWAEGETRRITVLVDRQRGIQTWLVRETMRVTRAQVKHLLLRVERRLPDATWLALCGSLPAGCPPDLFARIVTMAKKSGVPVLIDSRGAALLNALQSVPQVVKMNLEELEATMQSLRGGRRKTSRVATIEPILFERSHLELAVCTMGELGALAAVPGRAWQFTPPGIKSLSSAGSGDAFTAALLVRRSKGDDWRESLRWATAAGAAKAMEAGTDRLSVRAMKRLYRKIRISASAPSFPLSTERNER
jgi:1-phosphofructokinase family hexose kinase